jgi:hypothetical protein
LGRGGIRGGARLTKKEMAQKLFKKIQEEMLNLDRLMLEERHRKL